jgi:hypothetical protein
MRSGLAKPCMRKRVLSMYMFLYCRNSLVRNSRSICRIKNGGYFLQEVARIDWYASCHMASCGGVLDRYCEWNDVTRMSSMGSLE